MKKVFIIIISVVLVLGLLGAAAYFWVLNPIKVEGKQVDITSMEKDGLKDIKDKDKLPSKDFKDYKCVDVVYDVSYNSALELENFKAETYDFGLKDKNVFEVGKKELVPAKNDVELKGRSANAEMKGASFIVYAKGKSDNEVKKIAEKIVENINLKADYKIQFVGDMKLDQKKGSITFKNYELKKADKDNVKDDKSKDDKKDEKKDKDKKDK